MPTQKQPLLKKTATIEDKSKGAYFVTFKFRTESGKLRSIEVPRSDLSDFKGLEKRLMDDGALMPSRSERISFISEAIEAESPCTYVRPARSGWMNKHRTFVLQSKAVGQNKNAKTLGIGSETRADGRGRLANIGTVREWKEQVANPSGSSSLLMLSISCAFASPLLDPCNQENFSICLSGKTASGKSVATLVAASVIGIRRKSSMLTWHGSRAGLEQQMPRFNDCLCPIDDFEALRGSDTSKYQLIRDYSYGFTVGAEMTRHSSFGVPNDSWRSILLTSMEKPIGELARSVRQVRQGGETRRMIDVPVLLEGHVHVFDRPQDQKVQLTKKWRNTTFRSIVAACENAAGTAFERYVTRLCEKPAETKTQAMNAISHFMKTVSRHDDGDIAHDLARKFGLIYAGGSMAIRHKLVDWKRSNLLSAVQAYYESARRLVPDEGQIIRDGRQLMMQQLQSFSRKRDVRNFKSAVGYSIWKKSHVEYLVKVDKFNSIFSSTEQASLVLSSLIELGQIATKKPRNEAGQPSPKLQHVWADDQRRRSYLIVLPRSEAVSKN